MKKIILGLIVIMSLFVAGCAVEEHVDDDDHAEEMVDDAPVVSSSEDAVATTPAADAEEAVVAVAEGEVSLTKSTFDPDTLTVSKGATITFVLIDGPHLLSDNGERFSGRMNAGERVDYTFDEVGEHKVFDALLKATMLVTVTE
jgi:plastocyanin